MQKTKCLLCGEEAELMTTKLLGYQEPDTFNVWHCAHCNTNFTTPRVNSDNIYDLIYKNTNKVRGYSDYYEIFSEIKKKKYPLLYLTTNPPYWAVIYALEKKLKISRNAIIFEIGSGLGYFTYALRCDGYNSYGLDISQEAISQAKNNFGDYYINCDVFSYSEKNPQSVDVIILTDVIEHIEEPIAFLNALKKMLHKGGHIILTTPNKSFYASNVIWASDIPPVHWWFFSEDSFVFISSKLNLNIDFVDFSNCSIARISKLDKTPNTFPPAFDKKGDLLQTDSFPKIKKGIMPGFIKKLELYVFLRKKLFGVIAKFYSPIKTYSALCAVLTKNDY